MLAAAVLYAGLACAIVNCGEGTCRGSNETLLGIECDCNPGWKQIPAVSFAFPSCALPNCKSISSSVSVV